MTPEYQSKLNDAFKMVMERAAKKVDDFEFHTTEVDSIRSLDLHTDQLSRALVAGNMRSQKSRSTEIAATAILYMVEFL